MWSWLLCAPEKNNRFIAGLTKPLVQSKKTRAASFAGLGDQESRVLQLLKSVRRGVPCCASSLERWHGPLERISLLQRERALVLCTCMSLLAVFPEIQRKKRARKIKSEKNTARRKACIILVALLHLKAPSFPIELIGARSRAVKPFCPRKVLGFVERVGWGDKLRSP